MKKLFTLLATGMMAAAVSAQTVQESKTFDNIYVGINGGVATQTTGHSWLSDLNSNAGLRIGRWFTPVVGLAIDGTAYFSNKPAPSVGTAVRGHNLSVLGTLNLSNWLGGYKGEPRCFEVIPVAGLGWLHNYGHEGYRFNALSSKAGIDFAFNLGKSKQWQLYVEPSITWALTDNDVAARMAAAAGNQQAAARTNGVHYNINRSFVQLNGGIIYKFKTSNGTHNFKIAELRDQAEIDGLNAQINSLRNDLNAANADCNAKLAAKDRQIAELQKALNDCKSNTNAVKPAATATNLQPTVLFRVGKSTIDAAQYAPIELIASYMKNHPEAKVEIKGYASPEGNAELNQKLSEARAEAVKTALVKKYKIAASRLTTKGMGATDKLFEQVEFNRVATFNDNAR